MLWKSCSEMVNSMKVTKKKFLQVKKFNSRRINKKKLNHTKEHKEQILNHTFRLYQLTNLIDYHIPFTWFVYKEQIRSLSYKCQK
jgi:hypothetical protein